MRTPKIKELNIVAAIMISVWGLFIGWSIMEFAKYGNPLLFVSSLLYPIKNITEYVFELSFKKQIAINLLCMVGMLGYLLYCFINNSVLEKTLNTYVLLSLCCVLYIVDALKEKSNQQNIPQ